MINNKVPFSRTRLATGLSVALGAMMSSTGAMAQDQNEDPNLVLETVEVVGFRASLDRAVDVKRNNDGIVDAISAEDIGKFPDTNLAESLQRITGVSIDRANGEGSRVSVRGIGPDQNLVLLDGRTLARTTGGRSFDFQNVASEMVTGVSVYKTSDASMPTGGIGSTINLLTNRPLDNRETRASVTVKGMYDESAEDSTVSPELSGIYSTKFADDKFGISISGAYSERESGSAQANVGTGWRSFTGDQDNTNSWGGVPQTGQVNRPGPNDVYSVPQTTIYKFEQQQRERFNGQLVLQWAPSDDMTATLDYNYYENSIATQSNEISAWFTFAPSENVWTDGPVSAPLIYSETYGSPADLSMAAADFANRYQGDALGFNFEWQVSDALWLEFDASQSTAERTPDSKNGSSNTLSTAAFIRTSATADFTEDLPMLAVGGGNAVLPSDMRVTGSVFGNSQDFSEVDQYQLNGNFMFSEESDLDFGVSSTKVSNHSQSVNIQRNDWGGVGAAGDLDPSLFPAKSIMDQFDSARGDFSEVGGAEVQNVYFDFDFESLRAAAEGLYTPSSFPADALVGDCGTMFCPSTQFGTDTDRLTEETTNAVYGQWNYRDDSAAMPWSVHVGLRYEETDVNSVAYSANYAGADWVADTEIVLVRDSANPLTLLVQDGSYDVLLPNINFNIDVTEDIIARAGYSQTISRPDYNSIKGGTVIGTIANRGGGSGSAGNPGLEPLESENFDLSLEWYYNDSSYASVGLFTKNLTNFIGNSIVESTVFNLPNPADGAKYDEAVAAVGSNSTDIRDYIFTNYGSDALVDPSDPYVRGVGVISGDSATDNDLVFDVTIPTNNEREETIDGVELAVQHVFGESGFGMQANYTLVNQDNEFDNYVLTPQEAILGISDTANLVGFFENDAWSARVAWNWRDKFLSATGDGTGANPTYTEAYQQIDLSISYSLPMLEGLQLMVEGYNITDEASRTHGRASQQVLSLQERGARWVVGARYAF
ncbi:TonB-dependent receptor [uncultured Umboniibacter sp.]|uniref:TonB-dependent receptor n=1 Tax=uncultured Umboniibacter sp. TaxID=1798917 RepID=UPI00263704E4|nr:TonB-dependent receptor [uncultured Umboniibacter sp.]